jgi:hypothetical protein
LSLQRPNSVLACRRSNIRISPPKDFTPHRYGRRIFRPDRNDSQHPLVQIPIAPRCR